MVSRVERTPFARWWWTVDRLLLAALFTLMFGGLVLSLAASPPVAARLGLEPFYFVNRHVLYLVPAIGILLATSFLPLRHIRRIALLVFIASLVLMALTLVYGVEVKGARRWLVILGVNTQPSEFLKPAFVILIAWLFGESARRPEMPANTIAFGLLLISVVALVLQPDFGQTMLLALVWCILFFVAGMRLVWVAGLGGVAAVGLSLAYVTIPHVARRIKRFLDPSSGDTFNVDQALESFLRGGWFGRGPGEGTVKRALPESHADLVIAVAAEEFGIVLCLVLVASRAVPCDALPGPVPALCDGGARDPVRPAIRHQHGGESASDARQGHDAAVHLLWGIVDDLARLGHGNAARADARAAAD
jgi:cell division protein FtsW